MLSWEERLAVARGEAPPEPSVPIGEIDLRGSAAASELTDEQYMAEWVRRFEALAEDERAVALAHEREMIKYGLMPDMDRRVPAALEALERRLKPAASDNLSFAESEPPPVDLPPELREAEAHLALSRAPVSELMASWDAAGAEPDAAARRAGLSVLARRLEGPER